jgi:hypothetical protein
MVAGMAVHVTGGPIATPALGRVAVLAVAAGLLAGGCGGGGARSDARAVSQAFLRALQGHDGSAACRTLSPQARAHLENQEGKPCEQAIGGLGLRTSAVVRVQVFMTDAKADLRDGDSLFLSNGPTGWRLDAIGCTPTAGKPADRPYDCALEV